MDEVKNPAILIREAQSSDACALNALFNEVFCLDRNVSTWRWKFSGIDSNALTWTAVAETDGGDIVGQYPLIIRPFIVAGRSTVAAQAVDTAISPKHRGSISLIKHLRFAATQRAARGGAELAFGFPLQALEGIGRYLLKYDLLIRIPPRALRLNWNAAVDWRASWLPAGLRRQIGLVTGIARRWFGRGYRGRLSADMLHEAAGFDHRFDRLWERCRGQYRFAGIRDRAFLNWRFGLGPDDGYRVFTLESDGDELAGYVIVKDDCLARGGTGYIMDFLAIDGASLAQLFKAVSVRYSQSGYDRLVLFAMPGHQDKVLDAAGFRFLPESESVSVVYSFLAEGGSPSQLSDPACWLLSYADFDSL